MHIGLIGGIGPAATEFYYRGLIRAHTGEKPLQLTIAHADMDTLIHNLAKGEAASQAQLFNEHLEQLLAAGAEIAAVTSIAGHFCIKELEALAPLPLLNALTVLKDDLTTRGLTKIGLLGSSAAMASRLYGAVTGLDIVLPPTDELTRVSDAYFSMAGAQRATAEERNIFYEAGARLCSEQGAEVVLLAGTDMFLAFENQSPGFPTLDAATLHIEALGRLSSG